MINSHFLLNSFQNFSFHQLELLSVQIIFFWKNHEPEIKVKNEKM